MVKGGRCCDKTFREYLDADEENEIAEGFHYLEKIRQISRIIGKENLIVRVYEPQQLKGDQKIASDFMDVLDIVPDWKVWEKGAMENARLSGNYIEIKRVFNSVRRAGYLKVADWAYLFERLSPQLYKAENGYFTLEERKAFLGQYAAENEQIARDYLHREDGRLFYDMEMDFPLEDIHECNSFEEDLIRTFSAIICEQHDEINQLRKRNNVLTWKLMLQNVGERKVLFFGAGQKCRELLADVPCSVELIADNDIKKSGSIGGVNIVYTRGIRDWKSYFVVVTCMETGGIEEQLQKSGMEKDKDYVLAKEYYGWQI